MLRHDRVDRMSFARAVTFMSRSWQRCWRAGPEPGSGRTASPSLVLAGECKAPCPRVRRSLDDFRSFGLRVSETRLELLDRVTTEAGVAFAVNHHQYATAGPLTSRLRDFAFLGGSSAGVEGGLGGDWAFGWRAPFERDQGVFARLGVRGQLLGNGAFYASALELPVGQAGFSCFAIGDFWSRLHSAGRRYCWPLQRGRSSRRAGSAAPSTLEVTSGASSRRGPSRSQLCARPARRPQPLRRAGLVDDGTVRRGVADRSVFRRALPER